MTWTETEVGQVGKIHAAMLDAMRSIGAVAKEEKNKQQNFNFRGIDTVINVLGPVLREKGIFILPSAGEPIVDNYITKGGTGTAMCRVILPVTIRFVAEDGSFVECRAVGESADAGDKATTKAHSVALRTALLQTFVIPTGDPDPDLESHERAAPEADVPEEDVTERGWENVADLEKGWTDLKEICAMPGESGTWARAWVEAHKVTKGTISAQFLAEMFVVVAGAKKDGDWKANHTPPEVPT